METTPEKWASREICPFDICAVVEFDEFALGSDHPATNAVTAEELLKHAERLGIVELRIPECPPYTKVSVYPAGAIPKKGGKDMVKRLLEHYGSEEVAYGVFVSVREPGQYEMRIMRVNYRALPNSTLKVESRKLIKLERKLEKSDK